MRVVCVGIILDEIDCFQSSVLKLPCPSRWARWAAVLAPLKEALRPACAARAVPAAMQRRHGVSDCPLTIGRDAVARKGQGIRLGGGASHNDREVARWASARERP